MVKMIMVLLISNMEELAWVGNNECHMSDLMKVAINYGYYIKGIVIIIPFMEGIITFKSINRLCTFHTIISAKVTVIIERHLQARFKGYVYHN